MSGTTYMRKIVQIDESKCDGCGLCIPKCAEGALQIIDGKARLVGDTYCDGLGNCLGECPQDAISIIEREAQPFDESLIPATHEHKPTHDHKHDSKPSHRSGCPSSAEVELDAELTHWPIQLHLVAPDARFLANSDLLICADCVPFAFADFHRKLLADKSLIICCPKLDDTELYEAKLAEIFAINSIQSITVAHMEVPCCFGLSKLVKNALEKSSKQIPLEDLTISLTGNIK